MESQQLLTQCQILQHEVLAGSKCTDKPADEVPKQRNHGKNLSGRPVSDFSPSSSFHWTAIIWRTTTYQVKPVVGIVAISEATMDMGVSLLLPH